MLNGAEWSVQKKRKLVENQRLQTFALVSEHVPHQHHRCAPYKKCGARGLGNPTQFLTVHKKSHCNVKAAGWQHCMTVSLNPPRPHQEKTFPSPPHDNSSHFTEEANSYPQPHTPLPPPQKLIPTAYRSLMLSSNNR
ncbi:hypothetical protein TRVL_05781 [Trypanosoma vivax]|nr:hypothetical protein TRVL_05781 [Trypanosoma vivax]